MKTTQNIFNTKTLPQWIGLGLSVAGIAYYSANSTDILSFSAEPIAKVNNLAASLPLVHSLPTITKVEVEALEDVHKDLSIAQIEAVFREHLSAKQAKKIHLIAKQLLQLSAKYQISPSIILAIIQSESSFRFTAVSNVGAMGLMQVLPGTAKYIAKREHIKSYKKAEDLFDPMINLRVGVAYVSYLRARFGNSIHYIAAYNLGPNAVTAMINNKGFALGKVTKYVTEIHAQTRALRELNKNSMIAYQ